MPRKDFNAISSILSATREIGLGPNLSPQERKDMLIDHLAYEMAIILGASNPAFDKARFLAACGVK